MITVMLVEDHASYRQALEAVMALEDDLHVVAHVPRGDLAGAAAATHQPDVAIIDLDLPGVGGVDALADVRSHSPQTACLVLTALNDDVELGRAIEAGASAVIHKSVDITELLHAIRSVARGANLLGPDETVRRLQALATTRTEHWHAAMLRESLTPRELEVLTLLAQGEGNRTIADRLGISPETVQTHIRNLLGKFDVGSRLEAVAKALRLRLIEPPSEPRF
ncbi:MAG: response regulator transcription factor [Actinomycetota bacterium]|nr:response regulator transcription factor [Actinomycetota bacterium]